MAIKIGDIAREERQDTAANWTSNNPVPRSGEWCIETDTGKAKLGDGATSWTSLRYAIDGLPVVYDISAADTVIALPAITGKIQRLSYYWTGGDGSNTFSFTVSDAATINGDLATVWTGDGEGHIDIESDGSNWRVKSYDDYITTTDQKIWKEIDGTERQIISGLLNGTITTAAGGFYRTVSSLGEISRFHPYISIDEEICSISGSVASLCWLSTQGGSVGTTTETKRVHIFASVSIATTAYLIKYKSTGRWK